MSRSRGFTLLEFLVALGVLGLMMALAAGSLSFGARTWERAAERPAPATLDLAVGRLQSLLAAPYLGAVRRPDFSVERPFVGRARELILLRFDDVGARGLVAWRLALLDDAPGMRLEIQSVPLVRPDDLSAVADWGAPLFTLRGLDAAAFAYAAPVTGPAPDWRPAWADRATAPALIRIVLSRGSVERALVVRLATGG